MTTPERTVRADAAGLAAVIERAGGAIALGEEPSNFAAVLEAGAEPEPDARD